MKKNYLAYLELTLAMFFAGSTVVVGKYLLDVPVFISQAISLLFAVSVLLPIAHLREGSIKSFKVNKRDTILLFFQAVTGLFLFRIFILIGLRYTSAITSGIIMSTTPVVLTLFAFVFLKEKLYKRSLLGIVICMGGMMIINIRGAEASPQGIQLPFAGSSFILLAVVGEVLFTILRKKQSFEDKPITVSACIMFIAFLLFLPAAFYQLKTFNISSLGTTEILAIVYYGVCGSAIAYVCWFSGIAKVDVSVAAGFSGIMPLSSVVLSVLLLKEKVGWQHLIGMLMTIVSIYMIAGITHRKSKLKAINS